MARLSRRLPTKEELASWSDEQIERAINTITIKHQRTYAVIEEEKENAADFMAELHVIDAERVRREVERMENVPKVNGYYMVEIEDDRFFFVRVMADGQSVVDMTTGQRYSAGVMHGWYFQKFSVDKA